jgi:serralysin
MADLNGTSGNDVIQPFGDRLVLALNATSAAGVWPLVTVLVNGTAVLSNVSITTDVASGQTQVLSIALPAGIAVSSVTLQYLNDDSTLTEDRNLFVSSISLNGHPLPTSSATYVRIMGTQVDTIQGQDAMAWQGELRFTGPLVTGATPIASGTLSVDGGTGIDTVMLSGTHSDWSISQTAFGYSANLVAGGAAVNLSNVERLHFQSGNSVALDMSGDGHGAIAAEVISALFGQAALGVPEYVAAGINLLDQGMTSLQLVALAEATPLFHGMAGSGSNADFVNLLFQNVVGRAPSGDEQDLYVSMLNSGAFTQASLGLAAAQAAINVAHLVGVVHSGIEFAG